MKKLFFAVLIVVAALVFHKLLSQAAAARQQREIAQITEATIFDVSDEQITEADLSETAQEVEEDNPELTSGDDETVVAE